MRLLHHDSGERHGERNNNHVSEAKCTLRQAWRAKFMFPLMSLPKPELSKFMQTRGCLKSELIES